ncbi:amidohydrolase family protein [Candidatus Amarobacter glycogenicus]|uniref:amidohydrolase family protein n=1 Tax=Candidatus Amarobacter glycogenicus TaxID=3140699 RepID=UPI002A16E603|nr:amidohydrolase family protein [Dehalococcoidia bacterium]
MLKKADVLLTGGTVVTMDDSYRLYTDGAVAIAGDVIVAVGPTAVITQTYTAPEIINCQGKVIMPGLVNAHTHVPMTLLRGLNDDLRLDVWLGYLMPLEREFVTPDFVKLGTQIACAEMIRSGVTSFADMYYFEDEIAAETAVIGMRALLGQTVLIFPAPDAATYEDALVLCRRFIEKWRDHPLIQPAVAPHAWYTGTPEMNRACADLARAYDVPLHTHVSETAFEAQNSMEQNHMPVVNWLQKRLAGNQTAGRPLRPSGRGRNVCPEGSGRGHRPLPHQQPQARQRHRRHRANAVAGTKCGRGHRRPGQQQRPGHVRRGSAGGARMAKTKSNDPTVLPARQALELATIGGARAMHMADKPAAWKRANGPIWRLWRWTACITSRSSTTTPTRCTRA